MASKELIEKVARGIYEKRNGRGCKPWAYQTMSHQQPYLDDAKAAISTIVTALQEPTEGMRHSAYIFQDDLALHDGDVPTFDEYWRIGLAASALGERSDG